MVESNNHGTKRKDVQYIEEILVEIRPGERGKWKYEGMKKKSIAKKDSPGINALLKDRQTRFLRSKN